MPRCAEQLFATRTCGGGGALLLFSPKVSGVEPNFPRLGREKTAYARRPLSNSK